MSSPEIALNVEENQVQGQTTEEMANGNKLLVDSALDNEATKEEEKASEIRDQVAEEDACVAENVCNLTKSINAIQIQPAESCNNNVKEQVDKSLVSEVTRLDISEKTNQQCDNNGVIVLDKKNTSLGCLLAYASDDDSSDESVFNSSSEDSVPDSEEEVDSSEAEDLVTDINLGAIKKKPTIKPKTVTELMYEKLPIPNAQQLNLNTENKNFLQVGTIVSILDILVTIEAIPNTPAYDLETVFFYEADGVKKPLGQVFDILGQVTSPMYVICMNSVENIKKMGVAKGMRVYTVPESDYTYYVFVNELLKIKGSDASWVNDMEVPAEMAEYSDDETEFYSKPEKGAQRVQTHTKRPHGSLERYKRYERTMNKCNTINTRVHQLMDTHKSRKLANTTQPAQQAAVAPFNQMLFDPRVPPPYMSAPFQPYAPVQAVNNQQWYCYNSAPTATGAPSPFYTQNLQYFGHYVDGNCPGPSTSNN